MPHKSFNNLLNELKAIQPIVKIVKRVIEKGLGLWAIYAEKTLASKLSDLDWMCLSRKAESLRAEHEVEKSAKGYLLARGNWNKVSEKFRDVL